MAKKAFVRDDVPLSRFGVLVAQLESIVASASQQPPDALLCFDLLSDLVSAVDEEPKESILLWQRKCEDALYSLLILGAKRPIRHLASVAMARIIGKGDGISIYSRASSLQGFLSDGKKSEPLRIAGATQCLGELYRHFGRRITSGLLETASIATKLLKFNEDFVRQEALNMLQNALEGSAGNASFSAYTEAFRIIMRLGIGDKSFVVRVAAARCLKAFAKIGGPSLGAGELENAASCCVKALEDPVASVRDAFAEALGMLLAFGMNPKAQVQPRGKTQTMPSKKFEGGLQRHLVLPFMKACGLRSKGIRIGITLSWIFFLQAMHLKYLHPDTELQNFVLQVMEMLRADTSVDTQALACVLYILRVGVTDQMTEPTQRGFLAFLANQLQSPDVPPSMAVAALRTLSYTLQTLGEMPLDLKEVLDNSVVAAVSHFSQHVRVEAALALRALAVVDPTCVGGLISFGVTTLNALRETVSFEKGSNLQAELDSLHGQASVLAALVSISPNLPLGYPTRLPKLVLEVAKKLLTDSCRNPIASAVVEQAGWLLLSSLLVSMPKEELEDQVFDILSLWVPLFSGNPEYQLKQAGDLASRVSVWADAIDALTAFARCFLSPNALNSRVLLQPVLYYLSRALSYVLILKAQDMTGTKPSVDVFIISLLRAYQCLPDPMSCKSDHPQIIQLCTTPFRDASGCEESSCLRTLLDKRDAWLGPWIPGRDWFEDELRAFQGGKDGLLPCVWESELSSFPQPESISKTLVNQMLLCFGLMFSCQDNAGKLSLLGMIELCLKGGKKQPWRAISINNVCVGLLAGLKAVISLHPHQPLGLEILGSLQSICQGILSDGDIGESQRRAASESLGLLARFGDDLFTARMTRSLLGDVTSITDSNYAGSLALALGCIHRSAGGMALSTLVPPTVSSISSLAKSSGSGLQIWSLHGLLLTIESAGLSYVSQVQATLGLALDIFLSEENGWVDLYQGVGRLINAIVAVLGPELSPGSIFFSRCKFVIAEISSYQETATLIESVRFTQQLVLFAPQAVSVHSHVNTLLRTLMSRQPILRHLAVSTLRHLVEKDPVSIVNEQIEENLFHMLDEETDSEIGNLVRTTLRRLLYASCPLCPSNWISICRNMVLAASTRTSHGLNSGLEHDSMSSVDGEMRLETGDDGETMVSSYNGMTMRGSHNREKHLRYRTRTFAAECLSHLPSAVGTDPAHFDPSLARKSSDRKASGDFLVLHLQELVSLAYQISTIQFENMQPIGVELLTTIMEKFEMIKDPELPGHLLLEQYQAQLVSAVRTALDASSGPVLLEAGLRLATKMLTSGMISGDQAAVKRIFSLLSRPLDDFNDLYYPSFAEWVSCKIKIRLLAAHASLKCYSYSLLRRHNNEVPNEYMALLPLFSKSSRILGKYWISILKDYNYICLGLLCSTSWRPFLDGIQSPLVSSKLGSCLEEAWPMVLQAVSLDAIPLNSSLNGSSNPPVEISSTNGSISGYSMVELKFEEFQFLWGFALLILFQRQHQTLVHLVPLSPAKSKFGRDSPGEEMSFSNVKLYEVVLPVFQFLSTESFFRTGFLPVNICLELLQIFLYSIHLEDSWNSLAISVFSQVVEKCPEDFFAVENFVNISMELCLAYLLMLYSNVYAATSEHENGDYITYPLFTTAKVLLARSGLKNQMRALMAFLLIGHKCSRQAATESCFSKATEFVICTNSLLKIHGKEYFAMDADSGFPLKTTLEACVHAISSLMMDCIRGIRELGDKTRPDKRKLLLMKLAFSLEQIIFYANQAFELECHRGAKNDASSYLTYFNYCSMIMHTALTDSELQVQAIALQVLKAVVQKCSIEENGFVLFFMGEIIGDIFSVLQKMLEKSLTRESVAVAGECLKIMVLVQALSKANESEMLLMTLLLESIVMVFSASESDSSKEVNDIRSTAMKLVSHLAQVPSSAIIFKDVLLEMPLTHRQQLQGVIRASVSQDLNPRPLETSTSLVIKFPTPVEESREKVTSPKVDKNNTKDDDADEDEDEDEEDDWDTFQSFPAYTDMPAADSNTEYQSGEPEIAEDSSHIPVDNRLRDLSTSLSLNGVGKTADAKQNEAPDEPRISEDSYTSHAEPSDLTKLTESSEAMPVQQNEQLLSDPQPLEDVEISNKLSLRVDSEDIKQSLADTIGLEVSSVPLAATDSEGHGEADDCSQREHDPDGNVGSEGRLPTEMECRSVLSEKEKDGCSESSDHQNESAKPENEK